MNTDWKKYAQLYTKKNRHRDKKFIVEGARLCSEALNSNWEIEIAFITEDIKKTPHWPQLELLLRQKQVYCKLIPHRQLKQLTETENPQGIFLVMPLPSNASFQLDPKKISFILLLQGVADPGNLGAIIRTADWCNVDALILSNDCVDPFNSKVLRSTMGSIFHLPVYVDTDLQETVKRLKENGVMIAAATLSGENVLHQTHFQKPVALMLGSEARGITTELQKLCDLTVKIWRYGKAESLNVGIASGILMNHIAGEIFGRGEKRP